MQRVVEAPDARTEVSDRHRSQQRSRLGVAHRYRPTLAQCVGPGRFHQRIPRATGHPDGPIEGRGGLLVRIPSGIAVGLIDTGCVDQAAA
jgi:hypothetical protein